MDYWFFFGFVEMMLASSLYSITQGAGAPCFVLSNDGSLTTTRGHDPFFVLADFCLDTLFVQTVLEQSISN